jgi:AraC family transcriptional regulator of adaptative response/methylated-DNA-[protein]-cysteine methyltransferase
MKNLNPYRSPAQLVADACSENQVALLIPCHRVIRSDGSLGGYRWGTRRKRALLAQERANAPRTTA